MRLLLQLSVWSKSTPTIAGPHFEWGLDAYGNLIRFQDYGKRDSPYGWEIDHYPTPKALGGSDDISNLRPLHCKANASLGGLLGNALRPSTPDQRNHLRPQRRGLFGGGFGNALRS